MIDAYGAWHALGRVHSFETWIDGELVGGLYGVSLGRMFFGESMFAHRTDASKIALAALVALLPRARHRDDRLPAAHRATSPRSAPARSRAPSSRRRLGTALARSAVADWTYDLRLWEQLGVTRSSADRRPRTPGP